MKFTTSDGLQLYYEDEGEGIPILCLPGLTRNVRDFDDLAKAISGVRLVRAEYRGRGESDYDPDYNNYNVFQEMQDALALLDHLGIEKAVFLGTSRGGIIAMIAAAIAKDRMLGVLLNDIGPVIKTAGLAHIIAYLSIPSKAKTYREAGLELRDAMGHDFTGVSDDEWEVYAMRWVKVGPNGIERSFDPKLLDAVKVAFEQDTPDLWPYFDAMEGLPLGLIRGANSDLLDETTVREMQKRRPDMIYANVPGRGHVPFLDERESVAVIKALLATVVE